MSEKKTEKKYYSLKKIKEIKADYNILLGQKSNGKSYAVKDEILKDAIKNDRQFAYVRRWREDIKGASIEHYFGDSKAIIEKYTDGEYNGVIVYQGKIQLAKFTEDAKPVKGKILGYAFCLTGGSHYASLEFPSVYNFVFEEFITNEGYLRDEPNKLMILVSTILRGRKGSVYLIGNTLTRICPYFVEWGLVHTIRQKKGTIEVYKMTTEQLEDDGSPVIVTIAVERCEALRNMSSMIFGNSSKMIVNGEWESKAFPHLSEPFEHYKLIYKIYYERESNKFNICLLRSPDKYVFLYVYPAKDYEKANRIISDKYIRDVRYTAHLTHLLKYDSIVMDLMQKNRIEYSDNLCGTEFNNLRKGDL